MRLLIALILALSQPIPPPSLTARWQGSHTVRVSWQQPADVALTCLYHNRLLIQCYAHLAPGATFTTLGDHGPLDADAHPRAGDVFRITFDDRTEEAPLWWVLRLPMVWR